MKGCVRGQPVTDPIEINFSWRDSDAIYEGLQIVAIRRAGIKWWRIGVGHALGQGKKDGTSRLLLARATAMLAQFSVP